MSYVDKIQIGSTAYDVQDTKTQQMIAGVYSTSGTYAVGDYVTYDGKLYRCVTAIDTAEAWTVAHWTEVTVGEDVADLKSALNSNLIGIETFTTHGVFAIGGLNTDGTLKPSETTRVSSSNLSKMSFDHDILVSVKSGYVWGYIPFSGDTPGAWVGWLSEPESIKAGTSFVIQIRRNPEGTAQGNIQEYLSAITFQTKDAENIDLLKKSLETIGAGVCISPVKVRNLNVATNGTAYATASNYSTYYIPVIQNVKYKFTFYSGTSGARLAYSTSAPANGVSCTFIAENALANGKAEFEYTPQANGYVGVSAYKNASESLTALEVKDGELQEINTDIYSFDSSKQITTADLNIVDNGTAYAGNSAYRTYTIKVKKGFNYVWNITANSGNNYYRISTSMSIPANGIAGTFIESVNTSETSFKYSYIPSSDGYLSVSVFYNVITAITASQSGIVQGLTTLQKRFPVYNRIFEGELVTTKKQTYTTKAFAFNPIQPTEGEFEIPQDIAVFGNTLFTAFNGVKKIMMQDMTTGEEIASPQNNDIHHANTIMFSDEYYDDEDNYPLLYVSPEDGGYLRVFRITDSALTLVKTYLVDTSDTGYYTDMCIDAQNKIMYTFGYTENSYNTDPNGTNYQIMCCFDLKQTTTDGSGNLVPEMLFSKKLPYIMTHQGNTFFNNRIWIVSSDYTLHNTKIYVISPDGNITNIISDFGTEIKDKECEGITFFPDGDKYKMLLLTGDNKLHRVEFAY